MRLAHLLLGQCATVVVGIGLLAGVAAGTKPPLQPFALTVAFGSLYLVVARLTRAHARVGDAWRARHLRTAPAWLVAGVLVHVLPLAAARPAHLAAADWSRGVASLRAAGVAGTCAAVLGEELWFRGPLLNLVRVTAARLAFAAANAALFTGLHLLNPEFRVAEEGPEVFAAGACLTLVYFATGSFLAPLALHLGNNFAGAVVRSASTNEAVAEAASVSMVRAAVLVVLSVAVTGLGRGDPGRRAAEPSG